MMKEKGCIVVFFLTLAVPILLCVLFSQYRHFYRVGNMDFTFWKTSNGCYIMPYKFFGISIPKNNYMKASNRGGAIIFIGEDSTLYIFPEFTYELGADTIECNLSSYKHKYFPKINELKYIESIQDTIIFYKNQGYPYINIYIAEMHAQIGVHKTR